MKPIGSRKSRWTRALAFLTLLGVLALGISIPAQAATPNPSIEVVGLKVGDSITVRAHDVPGGKLFTVRMDKDGNLGQGGITVTVTNSGAGGTFDETYKIPDALKSVEKLAVRFETGDGFFLYTGFTNKAVGGPAPTPQPTPQVTPLGEQAGGRPRISVVAVDKNKTITVRAVNLPSGVEYVIRVGPYATFFTDYAITGRIQPLQGGVFDFNVSLPDVVKNVELATVRLDGGGLAVFNAFTNASAGSVTPQLPTPTPIVVATLSNSAITGACSLISTRPSGSVAPGADVDAVWKVKNTSGQTWTAQAVDYVFVSGAALHKKTSYDLPLNVKNGETVEIIVDMRAPSSVGVYSENWAVVLGSTNFCNLPVTITVK